MKKLVFISTICVIMALNSYGQTTDNVDNQEVEQADAEYVEQVVQSDAGYSEATEFSEYSEEGESVTGEVTDVISQPENQFQTTEEQFNAFKETADPEAASIWDFKDGYMPIIYRPTPEFMVFVDLAVLIVLMILGVFFVVRRKGSRPMTILAIAALVYLGIIRGGCICPVGAISNITMGLVNPVMVGLATVILFLAPLIIAFIAGRVFCTSGCPLGAIQQLFYKKKNFVQLPDTVNNIIKIVPILVLVATVWFAIEASCFLVCKLEPYKAIFFTGHAWVEQLTALIKGQPIEAKLLVGGTLFTWGYLLVILVVGIWIPRPFCRLLCPYGVVLGVVSIFSFRKRKIDKKNCVYCGMCSKVCPVQAIKVDRKTEKATVSSYSCVQCNRCSSTCRKDAIH